MAIKKLQNNFTTPEQSKRLLELGVPKTSADLFYISSNSKIPQLVCEYFNIEGMNNCVPCWSVGRLIEIISICGSIVRVARFNIINAANFYRSTESSVVDLTIDNIETLVKSEDIDFSKLEE